MKSTGIVRQVDELGRIVLPIELRRIMELNEGDPVEVFIDHDEKRLMFRKYRTQECLFCQSVESLSYFRGRFVCLSCIQDVPPVVQPVLLESAATLENLPIENSNMESIQQEQKRRKKSSELLKQLDGLMKSRSEASQSEWARILGVTPGRVSQLLKLKRNK
ncbi:AbrB/MazE/SpoVT family DNA-binding domain-containing protein [Paenibacillus sp. HB172176]|uniref:AbrB/MazE/SpoVT family DNA-binding domain-containing protein n=1 Tax=Paenibacillus sp. HB172176 TaxID=2493690 RepID=UPI00143A6CB6|nr:AbrB/MazE/SpoVT family DNA-binding domain-containing protein [Paenibacillus sp. HB172176]